MAAQSSSYGGYLHSPCPEGCCLFNPAHGEMALACQRAVAGGCAHGTACTDLVAAIVGLTDVAILGGGKGESESAPTSAA